MIICYIGGVGSGKTVSAVKTIVESDGYVLTNFKLTGFRGRYHRISFNDIIVSNSDKKGNSKVNWEFWDDIRKKHKCFNIFLDEAHNVISSRSSMTKTNRLMSLWISQIRKVLSDSMKNNIYIITQTPRKLDVNFRELTHIVIKCVKKELIIGKESNVYIKQYYYDGFDGLLFGNCVGRKVFKANPYFKYYDSYEMVKFSDAEEYI